MSNPQDGHRLALIAEPEKAIRQVLVSHVAALGYSAIEAASLETALRLAGEQRFSLAVCNVDAPGLDGLELRRRLERSAHCEVPVLYVSRKADAPRDQFVLRDSPLLLHPVSRAQIRSAIEYVRAQQSGRLKRHNGSLSGDLVDFTLADLCLFMREHTLSGEATFLGRAAQGTVAFSAGRPVRAEADALSGESAFREILGWESGPFDVQIRDSRIAPNIDTNLDDLLSSSQFVTQATSGEATDPGAEAVLGQQASPGFNIAHDLSHTEPADSDEHAENESINVVHSEPTTLLSDDAAAGTHAGAPTQSPRPSFLGMELTWEPPEAELVEDDEAPLAEWGDENTPPSGIRLDAGSLGDKPALEVNNQSIIEEPSALESASDELHCDVPGEVLVERAHNVSGAEDDSHLEQLLDESDWSVLPEAGDVIDSTLEGQPEGRRTLNWRATAAAFVASGAIVAALLWSLPSIDSDEGDFPAQEVQLGEKGGETGQNEQLVTTSASGSQTSATGVEGTVTPPERAASPPAGIVGPAGAGSPPPPSAPPPMSQIAALAELGELSAAEAQLRLRLQHLPDEPGSTEWLASVLADRGQVDEATRLLSGLAARGAATPQALFTLAVLSELDGDRAAARTHFSQFLAIADEESAYAELARRALAK